MSVATILLAFVAWLLLGFFVWCCITVGHRGEVDEDDIRALYDEAERAVRAGDRRQADVLNAPLSHSAIPKPGAQHGRS